MWHCASTSLLAPEKVFKCQINVKNKNKKKNTSKTIRHILRLQCQNVQNICPPQTFPPLSRLPTSPRTVPSERTTAAAVSSQLVSMPSTVKGFPRSGRPDRAGAPDPGVPWGGSRASSPAFSVEDPARRTLLALVYETAEMVRSAITRINNRNTVHKLVRGPERIHIKY